MAGVLRIITQAVLTATPRKRPPLGLLVIAKLTLQFFFHKKLPEISSSFYISHGTQQQGHLPYLL